MFSISIREMFSRCDKRFPRPFAERYSKSTDERLNSFLSISTHLIRPRVLNRWGEVGRKRGSRGCLSLLVFSWLWCLVPAEGLAQLLRIHTSMGWGEEGAWGLYLRSGASPRGTHGPSVPPVQCVPAPPQTCWRLLPCPTVRPSNLPQFLSPLSAPLLLSSAHHYYVFCFEGRVVVSIGFLRALEWLLRDLLLPPLCFL